MADKIVYIAEACIDNRVSEDDEVYYQSREFDNKDNAIIWGKLQLRRKHVIQAFVYPVPIEINSDGFEEFGEHDWLNDRIWEHNK